MAEDPRVEAAARVLLSLLQPQLRTCAEGPWQAADAGQRERAIYAAEDVLAAADRAAWETVDKAPDNVRLLTGCFRPNVLEGPNCTGLSYIVIAQHNPDDPPPLCSSAWQSDTGQGFTWPPTHFQRLPAPPEPDDD